jgi:hypothetical protein
MLVLTLSWTGLYACGRGRSVPNPWGQPGHNSGPIKDPGALRAALDWGKANAQNAQKALDDLYIVTQKAKTLSNRVRVQTKWSRLALHAAERKNSSQEPDPATVEQILQGPPLTVTFTLQGLKKDLVSQLDMFLVQGEQRAYAPKFRRGTPRPVENGGRIIAYEAALEGDFRLTDLNLKKSATFRARLDDGSLMDFDIPLFRLK